MAAAPSSFSTKGEYGVRLMVQLGRRFGAGPASLAEIATDEDLPRPYLEQLVMSLRDAGLVVSTRGSHGGYELARPPEQIAMIAVLHALEGPIAPMICATDESAAAHEPTCDRTARCTVNFLWIRIRDAISTQPRGHDPGRPRARAGRPDPGPPSSRSPATRDHTTTS